MTVPSLTHSILSSAIEYLGCGYSVILMHRPTSDGKCTCGVRACPGPGKHPRQSGWVNNPIRNAATARQIISRQPNSNMAILTGNGLLVLDVDPRNGGDNELKTLETKHGKLPQGPTVITGGGGRHLYFSSAIPINNSASILGPGLDIRAQGGCAVAPPSLHSSGLRYKWASGLSLKDLAPPPAPSWLIDLLRKREAPVSHSFAKTNGAHSGFSLGQRNNGMTSYAGLLIAKEIDLLLVKNLLIGFDAVFNKPALGADEVKTILSSIAGREIQKRNPP